jgi:hypothetical protein
MLTPLRSIKKLCRSWFLRRKQKTTRGKPASIQLWLESLEERLAPASVSDGGTALLSIVLGASENLAIVSHGTSYTFTSLQNFTAASGTDPANQGTAFGGLGTHTLTLTGPGLAQYTSGITITNAGLNDTVTFNSSGASAYVNNFTVALGNAGAGTITFNGSSNFGAFNLQASTLSSILLNVGASVTTTSGNVTLQAGDAGVTLNNATVKSTGAGSITIQGQGDTILHAGSGVVIENGATIAGGIGPVTITGTGGTTSNTQAVAYGVWVSGTNSAITSNGGNIQVTGQGGTGVAGSTINYGVYIEAGAQVSAHGNGNVSVSGTGGVGGHDQGVQVSGTISSSGGSVQVNGRGGPSGSDTYGVFVSGAISAGGNGAIAVVGTGGGITLSGQDYGVYVPGTIASSGGDVQITGTGGVSVSNSYGISVTNSGQVSAAGSGNITLQGTGGSTPPGHDYGINLDSAGTGDGVVSSGGNVTLIGKGGTKSNVDSIDNYGLFMRSARVLAGGAGSITILGTGGTLGSGVFFSPGSTNVITTSGGNVQIAGVAGTAGTPAIDVESNVATPGLGSEVDFSGDSMLLNSTITAGTQIVSLFPKTIGVPINLGGSNAAGTLGLTSAELGKISAGTLRIGNSSSGTITVSAPVALPQPILNVTSGSDIVFSPGSITTGGVLTLAPGATGAVKPITSGIDAAVTPGALGFASGSNLAIAINGTAAQSQFNQLSVLGDVNLTGVNLVLSGTLTPIAGQTFTIVNNQGTHPIVGTFSGLPEGAVIANFLGSSLNATISYLGGDGNDVVLTVKQPNATTVATATAVSASAATSTYGQPVTFTATVTSDSTAGVSQGQAGYVFSNLVTWDHSNAYVIRGSSGSGSSPAGGKAMPFTPTVTASLTTIELPLGVDLVPGTNKFVVELQADAGGSPGAVLESFTVTNTPYEFSPTESLSVCTSTFHPVLSAGVKYWLAVYPGAADTSGGWNWTSPVQTGIWAATPDGRTTWIFNQFSRQEIAAFRVSGQAVPPLSGKVEFFDDTTGADLGPGIPVSGTAAWTYTPTPTQLQVTSGPHIIRAVYTGLPGFLGSSGILPGGESVLPAPLTVSGITASNKVYDATTTATLNTAGATLAGVIAGDTVTLNTSGATGMFAAKDVGNNIPVNVSGLTIGGPQVVDYTLIQPTTTANITPATALNPPLPMIGNDSMLEGTSGFTLFSFRASLAVAPKQPITYDVYTTDGTAVSTGTNPNFVAIAPDVNGLHSIGTVSFAPGQIARTITVSVIGGSLPISAGSKSFTVNLSSPTNPNVSLASGTGTIIPQNSPTHGPAGGRPKVLIGNSTMLEGAGGLTPFKFQVRLAAASTVPVTYDVYTTDGSAVSTGPNPNFVGIHAGISAPNSIGTVTFAPGQVLQTITVYVIAGSLPVSAGTKNFTVSLSDPANPLVPLATATGSIIPQTSNTQSAAVSTDALDQVFAELGVTKVKM